MSSEKDLALEIFRIKLEIALDRGLDIENRSVQLIGDVDEKMFSFLDSSLTILEAQNRKSITIKINSLGGSVYDGAAIVARIKSSKCKIITECYGAAMSAASAILACGSRRRISSMGWVMWHEAGYEASGTHTAIAQQVRQMEREEKVWARLMEQHSSRNEQFWLDVGRNKDYYINAEQCLELGLVDEIF